MKEDKDISKIFLSIIICIIAFIFLFRFAKGCQSVSKIMVYQYPVALVEFKDEDTGEHFVGVVNLEEDNIIFKDADDL